MRVIFILGIFAVFLVLFSNLAAADFLSFSFNTSAQNDSSFVSSDIVRSGSLLMQVNTDKEVTCKYSSIKGRSYSNMEETFDLRVKANKKEIYRQQYSFDQKQGTWKERAK